MAGKRHQYDYRVLPGSVASIVPEFVRTGARVLELGTGPGAVTRQLHAKGCVVTGMEIDPDAIAIVRPYCKDILPVDLNRPDWASVVEGESFDAVVMTDVLEHLVDPWRTLSIAAGLVADGGDVILSLPHIGHAAVVAGLLQGHFDYQPWGLLDRTHVRFFGMHNIQDLLESSGLAATEVRYVVKSPRQTEFDAHWRTLGEAQRAALLSAPHAEVYQVIVKARPIRQVGPGLFLPGVAPQMAAEDAYLVRTKANPVLRFVSAYLPRPVRQWIASQLRRMGIPL